MNCQSQQNPPQPSPQWYRVGDKVFDENWNILPVCDKNGWKCIKRNGKYTGVSSLPDKTGDCFPVYWNGVFGEGELNAWCRKLLDLPNRITEP